MEIEINFRLDENGRTAPPASSTNDEEDVDTNDTKSTPPDFYDTKTTMTNLSSLLLDDDDNGCIDGSGSSSYDDLLLDCQISDSCLMPRTFWVSCTAEPRCTLERFALDIYNHHVHNNSSNGSGIDSGRFYYDQTCSGAEWWCQLRPSPEGTGRYSVVNNNDNKNKNHEKHGSTTTKDDDDDKFEDHGISFHVDKDEDLRIMCGGNTYIHPHLSTVTYFTSIGPPTLIMENVRVHPMTGEWMIMSPSNDQDNNDSSKEEAQAAASESSSAMEEVKGFISWPKTGKHTSFDGRFLHAAPPDLMRPGEFEKQIRYDNQQQPEQQQAYEQSRTQLQKRRHRRVTFLVNIWLNYKPFNVEPFPDSMIDKMSGSNNKNNNNHKNGNNDPQQETKRLKFLNDDDSGGYSSTKRFSTQTIVVGKNHQTKRGSIEKTFVWPLGDQQSGERLEVVVPDIDRVRDAGVSGNNVEITWKNVTAAVVASSSSNATIDGGEQKHHHAEFCLYSPHIYGLINANNNDSADTTEAEAEKNDDDNDNENKRSFDEQHNGPSGNQEPNDTTPANKCLRTDDPSEL
jgi:hypothetical protein